ncbi:HEPN domain-containing protein [Pantoea sp. XAF26B01_ASV70]
MKELDLFYDQLDKLAPINDPSKSEERKKFAIFYVVCVAATYENCIREILYEYSDFYHKKFSFQVEKKYERLNSKIKYNDLKSIIASFDGNARWFEGKCSKIGRQLSKDLLKAYDQTLEWRHSAAHANKYPTSLEEIYRNHSVVKYVIYAFEEALLGYVGQQLLSEASKNVHFAKQISIRVLAISSSENEKHMEIIENTKGIISSIDRFKKDRRIARVCNNKSLELLTKCSQLLDLARGQIRTLSALGNE